MSISTGHFRGRPFPALRVTRLVKAQDNLRLPSQTELGVAICDFKLPNSSVVNWIKKSDVPFALHYRSNYASSSHLRFAVADIHHEETCNRSPFLQELRPSPAGMECSGILVRVNGIALYLSTPSWR
jgi:hypothetical protein